MAASFNESQKIDYLWKKVGYGVTKTAEPASKEAFNESIASPLLYRGDLIWTQSGDIPATPPAATTALVQVYKDGVGSFSPAVQCTEDLTAPDNQTWKTNFTNWIPTQFGDNYLVQVYAGAANISNPQTAGTKLFGAGSGSDDTWFFDYQSGVLNFNGATIPTAIGTGTANTIYVVGYRYVGEFGVDTTFIGNGTSNVNIASSNANVTISVNGTSNVAVFSNTGAYITGVVSASGNITGNYFIGNGSQLTGVTASSVDANALTGNTLSSNVLYSSLTSVGTLSNVSVSGNVLTSGLISSTGNITGGNLNAAGLSLSGNVLSVINSTSNITTTANAAIGNLLTDGLYHANGVAWDFQQPAGSNTQIQYNDGSGGFGASANFTFNDSTQLLSVGGAQSVTGNITSGNLLTGGLISATGNITGGNILTVGIVSTSGNVYGNAILSNNYYYANGTPVPPGITYTANTAPPTSPAPKVTDQWYDTASDVLYQYIDDGTNDYWVDTTSPAFAGGVVANVAISGTLVPVANVTYDIGTNTVYFRNTYTQNLYTNNRLTASNMPSGAVVQTIMSTSLGGSATTGTSYSDIALANVVIQPSSANSKVLIIATGTSSFTPLAAANLTASTQLVRTAASLQVQEYSANIAGGGVGGSSAVAFSYLDSPNTTSPVTYKMQQKISNSSSTLTSSNMWIIAMEIAVP